MIIVVGVVVGAVIGVGVVVADVAVDDFVAILLRFHCNASFIVPEVRFRRFDEDP